MPSKYDDFHSTKTNSLGFFHEIFIKTSAEGTSLLEVDVTIGFNARHRCIIKKNEKAPDEKLEYGLSRAELRLELTSCCVDLSKPMLGGLLELERLEDYSKKKALQDRVTTKAEAELSMDASAKASGKVNAALEVEQVNALENGAAGKRNNLTVTVNVSNKQQPAWTFIAIDQVLTGNLPNQRLCSVERKKGKTVAGKSQIHIYDDDIVLHQHPSVLGGFIPFKGMRMKALKKELKDKIVMASQKKQRFTLE